MKTLEGSGWFPVVAWTVVICFGLFTLKLTLDLREVITQTAAAEELVLYTTPR